MNRKVQESDLAASAGDTRKTKRRHEPAFSFDEPETQGIAPVPYWLMKSEPDEFSIDDLAAAPGRKTAWSGVRNYQARNFMRDSMRIGDQVFFYHSSCPEPGIAGIAEIVSEPYHDASQFDASSPYFDPASRRDAPRWFNVEVRFVRKTRLVGLGELRGCAKLSGMRLLAPGNRLSITPVGAREWNFIARRLMKI